MKTTVRMAQLSDVPLVTDLYNSDRNLFGEDETGYEEADILEYISDPKKKMFLCICENSIAGALLAEYHDTYVYLDTLIVRKELQGSGLGKVLMEAFEKDVREKNIPLIEALTEVHNSRMQQFFERKGYKRGNQFVFYSKKTGC